MDWKSLAPIVGAIAPAAGSILGGLIPIPGAGLIGQKFGEIIAQQLGVAPTPQAVSDALGTAKEETARAAIDAALQRARAEIQGFVDVEKAYYDAQVASAQVVNQTMQVELSHQSWFFTGWRPAIGWSFWLIWTCFGAVLVVATVKTAASVADPLSALSAAWPIYLAYFGVGGAMVGVIITGRSNEKVASLNSGTPMPGATATTKVLPTIAKVVAPVLSKPALSPTSSFDRVGG